MAPNPLSPVLTILALAGVVCASAAVAGRTRLAAQSPTEAPAAPARPQAPEPLLGHVTRDQVRAYAPWQPLFAEPYVPDSAAAAAIKANAEGVTVLLVMATWCPDSRREMPRFFAIMDGAGIGDAQLTMVGVDRTKKDAEGLTEKWAITRVPTFVFLRNGQEAGRVVERTPAGSTLEGEIARILAPKS
jgi:thiol-disulfide isomerase/thioredoxin